jgi:hypothetical protein
LLSLSKGAIANQTMDRILTPDSLVLSTLYATAHEKVHRIWKNSHPPEKQKKKGNAAMCNVAFCVDTIKVD